MPQKEAACWIPIFGRAGPRDLTEGMYWLRDAWCDDPQVFLIPFGSMHKGDRARPASTFLQKFSPEKRKPLPGDHHPSLHREEVRRQVRLRTHFPSDARRDPPWTAA